MSAAADKARYYLEQSVPELKELERKKLFAPKEITVIAKRRSDFEHKINARGSSPVDYAQYAEFEINVDALRKKRVKRLGVKINTHNGQRRIFFVFDRGTRKFPGDKKLWMQAIEYARSQKALKKVTQMLTNFLRLHPAKSELWIYAAQFALEENGDMTEARGYMQRGLRFCKHSKELWVQNYRLELNWIVKIHARRRILGVEKDANKEEKIKIAGEDDNIMVLPDLTAEGISPDGESTDKVDVTALATLESTPITTGAIPIAIVDAAIQQFPNDSNMTFKFYQETVPFEFEDLPAFNTICSHINHVLNDQHPRSWHTAACNIAMPLNTMRPLEPEYPAGVRESLSRINQGLANCDQPVELSAWCLGYLTRLLANDLDPGVRRVLESKWQTLSVQTQAV